MDLRMFIDLFQEIEVENLFKALDLCMEYVRLDLHVFNVGAHVTCSYSNDLESLSQAEGCNVNMIIEVPYLFEAFMEYASPEMKLYYEKLTMWMVGYLAVKEKPIAMIQPTEKDGWCAFRQPGGLCELHDRGLKPTEGVLASCKVIEEDNVPTYETSVLRAVAHEWVKVENFATIMRVVFKYLHENERRK